MLIHATRAQAHNSSQRRGRQEATRCGVRVRGSVCLGEGRGSPPPRAGQRNLSPLATERTSSIGAFESGLKKNNEGFLTSAKWGSDLHPRDRRRLNGTLFSVAEAWLASTPDGKGPAHTGNHHPSPPTLFFANKTGHPVQPGTLLSAATRRPGREARGHATLLTGRKAGSFQA